MRRVRKRWKNGKGNNWTCRMKWSDDDGYDIVICLEDAHGSTRVTAHSKRDADNIWQAFKMLAVPGCDKPIIAEVLSKRRPDWGTETCLETVPAEYRELVVKLAAAADRWGLRACDVVHEPKCCKQFGIDPDTITPAICHHADELNREEFERLCRRYGVGGVAKTKDEPKRNPPPLELPLIYGHSVASVIRWCGQDAWTVADVTRLMIELDIDVSGATIRTQLCYGRRGTKPPAELTEEQMEKLRQLAGA